MVADVCVGRVRSKRVIWLNVKPIDVVTTGIWLIVDDCSVISIEDVRSGPTVTHSLGLNPRVGDDEVLSHRACQLIIQLISDCPSEGDLYFHEICSIIG